MGPTVTGAGIAAVVRLAVIRSGDTNGFTTTPSGPLIATVEPEVGMLPMMTVEGGPVEAAGRGEVTELTSEAQGCPHTAILRANVVRVSCSRVISASTRGLDDSGTSGRSAFS